jgi:hypothetical protein
LQVGRQLGPHAPRQRRSRGLHVNLSANRTRTYHRTRPTAHRTRTHQRTTCLAVKRQKALTLKVKPGGTAAAQASQRCGAGMA